MAGSTTVLLQCAAGLHMGTLTHLSQGCAASADDIHHKSFVRIVLKGDQIFLARDAATTIPQMISCPDSGDSQTAPVLYEPLIRLEEMHYTTLDAKRLDSYPFARTASRINSQPQPNKAKCRPRSLRR